MKKTKVDKKKGKEMLRMVTYSYHDLTPEELAKIEKKLLKKAKKWKGDEDNG